MILTCPECKSRYVVNPNALMPNGRTVRCAKCSHNWFEDKPKPDVEIIANKNSDISENTNDDDEQSKPHDQINKPENSDNVESDNVEPDNIESDENFQFPISKPKKRKRPMPKGTNLPALQNHNYGSNKIGWISLMAFITIIISSFLLFQNTLTIIWPPSEKLYIAIGLDENHNSASLSEQNKIKKPPKEIPIDERLVIRGISTTLENRNNIVELVISGDIENISQQQQTIPVLKVILQDINQNPIREWIFKADKSVSNPGEIVTFATSLPTPPPEAKNVSVSITTK